MAKNRRIGKKLRSLISPESRLDNRPDYALVGIVRVPLLETSPWKQIFVRLLWAFGALVLAVIITYAERSGYQDGNDPENGMTLVDCIYYATVTLTTTGYGDITPVTQSARLANVVLYPASSFLPYRVDWYDTAGSYGTFPSGFSNSALEVRVA